jgi:hypothetical protein
VGQQALGRQDAECFAQGNPAHAQPRGHLVLANLVTWLELALHHEGAELSKSSACGAPRRSVDFR